jgi:hypothetical protein
VVRIAALPSAAAAAVPATPVATPAKDPSVRLLSNVRLARPETHVSKPVVYKPAAAAV